MKWINRLYIFFLAIILSITTGFGIAAFYPQPTMPSYPSSPKIDTTPASCYSTPEAQATPDCQGALKKQSAFNLEQQDMQQKYETDLQTYQNKNASYTRTAIFFGIFIGAIYAIIGIIFLKKSKLISTGFLFASVLTAIFTRVLINLASLGYSVSGTNGPDLISYLEFFALLILSVVIVIVGQHNITDSTA